MRTRSLPFPYIISSAALTIHIDVRLLLFWIWIGVLLPVMWGCVRPGTTGEDVAQGATTDNHITEEIDFGIVRPGSTTDKTLSITNTSSATWVISHVVTSCGCVTAQVDRKEVPPGDSLLITAQLSADLYRKSVSQTIRVFLTGKSGAHMHIRVAGMIVPYLTSVTPDVTLHISRESTSASIVVYNTGHITCDSIEATSNIESIDISIEPLDTVPSDIGAIEGWLLTLTWQDDLPSNDQSGLLSCVGVAGSSRYTLEVPVLCKPIQEVHAFPRSLVFEHMNRHHLPRKRIRVILKTPIDKSEMMRVKVVGLPSRFAHHWDFITPQELHLWITPGDDVWLAQGDFSVDGAIVRDDATAATCPIRIQGVLSK